MDTTLLKSFATSSRTELIREVAARITAVLAPGSPERVEQPRAVSALERAISAGGGGDKGKAHVADKVAYTWFNRIIALRFMDANGYTGIGVVSPATDQVGQPEILAAAKRGQIDDEVVKAANAATIRGLLNGTRQPRPGVDAQAEAYSLLLADYCRYWNRAMPFMFEREGDFTELLIPANVLAEDSVLSRSVSVLTENVCQDVEVIGWLYQFYISERKDEVFAGFKKNKKAGADEIPAATQLFTPHWIVRYLVENSVGRLWMLNHPESRLVDQMDYYIAPVDEETDFLKISKPEELTVIDPACGSGHMLTYAFDLLYAIYEEEGYTPSQIPGLILTNNLYGTEIDPRAGALAAFALTMKAAARRKLFLRDPVEPNICVVEAISFRPDEIDVLTAEQGDDLTTQAFWNQFEHADTFGSLVRPDLSQTMFIKSALEHTDAENDIIYAGTVERARKLIRQAEILSNRYAVVVANPPYMGSKQMNGLLSQFMKDEYPDSKSDLFAAFIERCSKLTTLGGQLGFMTPYVWMFIKSYEPLRKLLLTEETITSLIQLEYSGFDGATVPICAFTFQHGSNPEYKGGYIRLADFVGPRVQAPKALEAIQDQTKTWFYRSTSRDFTAIPGSPIVYWLSEKMRGTFATGKPLSEVANLRQGLATADNNRFLRQWWEVSTSRTAFSCTSREEAAASGARWFPYNKGGEFRKWYGNQEYVVNWENDGAEIVAFKPRSVIRNPETYFSPSVSWSKISSGAPAFRSYPPGFIYDVAGTSIFVTSSRERLGLLSFTNSQLAFEQLAAIAPTLNFEIGQVASLPIVSTELLDPGHTRTRRLIAGSKLDWDSSETSWAFKGNPLVALQLKTLEQTVAQHREEWAARSLEQQRLEIENNEAVAKLYGLEDEVPSHVPLERVSLTNNSAFRWPNKTPEERDALFEQSSIVDLISYAVGCMFGRYSLDVPGLILADQGATVQDYFAKVQSPKFLPDADNVIPIVDGDWFEDDIVERFRQFLRAAFGEQHFEENLQFVTKSLGVKHLRDYFVKSFYKDHVKRYKKRPIYWLFSSPKGSFNALIYMHRYTPSTVSTVLTYLREYVTKLESSLQQAERAGNAKEADRLRKILVELNEYEHDTLFPKASENIVIDLDDGVKVNYPKFGAALKKIPGLEAASD